MRVWVAHVPDACPLETYSGRNHGEPMRWRESSPTPRRPLLTPGPCEIGPGFGMRGSLRQDSCATVPQLYRIVTIFTCTSVRVGACSYSRAGPEGALDDSWIDILGVADLAGSSPRERPRSAAVTGASRLDLRLKTWRSLAPIAPSVPLASLPDMGSYAG